jgi:hypothetical protein
MAGFQLAGPAADVSKILYRKSRKLYGEPQRTVHYGGYTPRFSDGPYA